MKNIKTFKKHNEGLYDKIFNKGRKKLAEFVSYDDLMDGIDIDIIVQSDNDNYYISRQSGSTSDFNTIETFDKKDIDEKTVIDKARELSGEDKLRS